MAKQLAVQAKQRLIQGSQSFRSEVGQSHINDPPILLTAQPVDEPSLLQPVDQAGNAGHHGNGPGGDLQDGQRLTLAPQDTQNVVLRWRQAMVPEQPGETNLDRKSTRLNSSHT